MATTVQIRQFIARVWWKIGSSRFVPKRYRLQGLAIGKPRKGYGARQKPQ